MDHQRSHDELAPSEHPVSQAPVTQAIYGLITVLAVLEAMDAHPPEAWTGTIMLFGTTLAVALTHAYCESIAEMLARHRRLTRDDLRVIGRNVAPVLTGAQAPTALLLASALGLISVERAITLAQVVAFVFLFSYGWRVGQILHESWQRQFVSGLLLVAIGGLVVGVKAAFH